jgi:hypothetical protein
MEDMSCGDETMIGLLPGSGIPFSSYVKEILEVFVVQSLCVWGEKHLKGKAQVTQLKFLRSQKQIGK